MAALPRHRNFQHRDDAHIAKGCIIGRAAAVGVAGVGPIGVQHALHLPFVIVARPINDLPKIGDVVGVGGAHLHVEKDGFTHFEVAEGEAKRIVAVKGVAGNGKGGVIHVIGNAVAVVVVVKNIGVAIAVAVGAGGAGVIAGTQQ